MISTLGNSPAWLDLVARAEAQQPVTAAGASTTLSVANAVTVQIAAVTMTAAQFVNSKSAPIQLLPRPNIGTYYTFVAGVVEFHYGSTVPASNTGNVSFVITEPTTTYLAFTTTANTFNGRNFDCVTYLLPKDAGIVPPTGPVAVTYTGATYTGVTDGTFVAKIWYTVASF
jgi:hypothetical protein